MKKNMTEKLRAAQRLARRLDIPAETFYDAARVTISGGSRVLIEGHRGLLEYAEDRVAAAAKGCSVIIKGEDLTLDAMSGRDMVVSGRLWSVEFE